MTKLPTFDSDEALEAFMEGDLSEYITADNFRPVTFEFTKKDQRVNMRLPGDLLAAVKAKAKERGLPYQRFIREILERAVQAEPRQR